MIGICPFISTTTDQQTCMATCKFYEYNSFNNDKCSIVNFMKNTKSELQELEAALKKLKER